MVVCALPVIAARRAAVVPLPGGRPLCRRLEGGRRAAAVRSSVACDRRPEGDVLVHCRPAWLPGCFIARLTWVVALM